MSLNEPRTNIARVMDPRININNNRTYAVLIGGSVNNFQQFPATNVNNDSVQITMNPPSNLMIVSKRILKKFSFDISITGTNTGPSNSLLVPGYYAPRFLPIMNITGAESLTINNDTLTQAPINQYFTELLRYNNEFDYRNSLLSLSPSMMDQAQNYSDTVASARNPLGTYTSDSYEVPRGGYVGLEVLTNTKFAATLRLTVIEPIMISPLSFGKDCNTQPGFIGIENMSYSCTVGNLNRCMSFIQNQGAPGVINITNIITNLASASILCNYLTPASRQPIPRQLVCPYFGVTCYPTRTTTPIGNGQEVSITMQSIQVASVPRRLYLFARADDSLKTAYTSDATFALGGGSPISVNWNNNIFLSSATTEDLYNISVKNKCNLNYSQYQNFTGCVVCLDFGTDIGLTDQSPGMIGNYNLQITCRFKNTNTTAIAPTLYCVVVTEGTFNIDNGSCSHRLGVLSQADVVNARPVQGVTYKHAEDIYGGNFFDSVKGAFNKANDWLKKSKIISKGLSYIPDQRFQAGSKLASSLGYGLSGGSLHKDKNINKLLSNASDMASDYDDDDEAE